MTLATARRCRYAHSVILLTSRFCSSSLDRHGFATCQSTAWCIFPFVFCLSVLPVCVALSARDLFRANRAPVAEWPISASMRPLRVYIYAFGSQSCGTRLILLRSARRGALRPLRFARALDRYAICAASLRKASPFCGASPGAKEVAHGHFGHSARRAARLLGPLELRALLTSALHPRYRSGLLPSRRLRTRSSARYCVAGIPASLSRLNLAAHPPNRSAVRLSA